MIISYTGTNTMEDSKCLLARMTNVMYLILTLQKVKMMIIFLSLCDSLRSDDALPPLQSEEVELGKLALKNLPRFGTVLRVRIDKSFEGLYINLRTIGEWVKLRSLTFKVQSDRWYAELTHNSTMRLLTEETSIVIEWMR